MGEPRFRSPHRYRVEVAGGEGIFAAQRLRYRVFAEELGARLSNVEAGLDHDDHDPHCRHLIGRDLTTGEVVACTRLLTDTAAAKAGGDYSQGEFEIGAVLAGGATVQPLALGFSEVGRPSTTAPYVGEDAFVPHLLRVLAAVRMRADRARHLRSPRPDPGRRTLGGPHPGLASAGRNRGRRSDEFSQCHPPGSLNRVAECPP